MPTYNKVSKKVLNIWLNNLNKFIKELYYKPEKNKIIYFIILLYECIQVMSTFKKLETADESTRNKIISELYDDNTMDINSVVKDIKQLQNDEYFNQSINLLKGLRDKACHSVISDSIFLSSYIDFLFSSKFDYILDKLDFDKELIINIKDLIIRLKFYYTKDYKENCIKECKELLKVKDNNKAKYTVSEVITKLKDKYDLDLLYETIISIIEDYEIIRQQGGV